MAANRMQLAWELREEEVYPELFGGGTSGIYPLDESVFATFGITEVDPRWLMHGVIQFPPTAERDGWMYVTSGLSNAWWGEGSQNEYWSGLGCELVMQTAESADWALVVTRHVLAYQLLIGWGRMPGKELLNVGDRISFGAPIDRASSSLTGVILAPPLGYARTFELPTGRVALLHLVGITTDEADFANEHGVESLLRRLHPRGYPATDAARTSVLLS